MPTGEAVKSGVNPKIIINGEYTEAVQTLLFTIWKVFLECECQFDKSRNLEFYSCSKIDDYKDHIHGFFKFYGEFAFSKVMSTVNGAAITQQDYSNRFPKFLMEGIPIAGLCNERKNCGVCDENTKQVFIALCKATAEFFTLKRFWTKTLLVVLWL